MMTDTEHDDLTEELTVQLERTKAPISRLWATLLHVGAYDEILGATWATG